MKTLQLEDVGRIIWIESGTIRNDRLTLFSTIKNEMEFLPIWLAYHRSIGFDQFLIWDDSSTDGSFEYLCKQPDCTVLRSNLSFGQPINYLDPKGVRRSERFGIYMKSAGPHHFLKGQFVGYLDADEFLLLPPGVDSVSMVIERLQHEGASSCVSSVIEFFPSSSAELKGEMPSNFASLLKTYPYYQDEKLVELSPTVGRPRFCGLSKTARLYSRYGVEPPLVRRGWHRLWMPSGVKKAQRSQTSPRYKTPLILRDGESYQVGSHNSSLPPSCSILLAIAHFVFTARSQKKILNAIAQGSHAHGGRKYHGYAALLQAMEGQADGFIDELSVRYEGPEKLITTGLMHW